MEIDCEIIFRSFPFHRFKKGCCQLQNESMYTKYWLILGRVAQSVMSLATDVSLTADPGVVSLIPAQSHTFVEIDRKIIFRVILLPSAESFKKGCQF